MVIHRMVTQVQRYGERRAFTTAVRYGTALVARPFDLELDGKHADSGSGGSVEGDTNPLDLPDSRVWCIGTNLPAEAIEANALQGVQINTFEAPYVDHVVLGLRARTEEGGDAAIAAEVV